MANYIAIATKLGVGKVKRLSCFGSEEVKKCVSCSRNPWWLIDKVGGLQKVSMCLGLFGHLVFFLMLGRQEN